MEDSESLIPPNGSVSTVSEIEDVVLNMKNI
jgi:hypothetical protein